VTKTFEPFKQLERFERFMEDSLKFSRRDFIKASLITGTTALLGSELPVLANITGSTDEEFKGPLPGIDIGGLIRPPGALGENSFRSKCVSCGVCVNVCHVLKYNAIAAAGFNPPKSPFKKRGLDLIPPFLKGGKGGLSGLKNFGTPYIKAMRDFPCTLCMECPKHCPTGALQEVTKEETNMGMALIDFSLCFGWNGDVCLSCSKACPLGAKVFDFYYSDWGNQPVINENCVGCGLCVRYCVLGGSAVKVIRPEKYKPVATEYKKEFERVLTMSHADRYSEVYSRNLPKIMSKGRLNEREFR
jgi:ferredoxin